MNNSDIIGCPFHFPMVWTRTNDRDTLATLFPLLDGLDENKCDTLAVLCPLSAMLWTRRNDGDTLAVLFPLLWWSEEEKVNDPVVYPRQCRQSWLWMTWPFLVFPVKTQRSRALAAISLFFWDRTIMVLGERVLCDLEAVVPPTQLHLKKSGVQLIFTFHYFTIHGRLTLQLCFCNRKNNPQARVTAKNTWCWPLDL